MRRISLGAIFLVFSAFIAGLLSHFFYQRWTASSPGPPYPVTHVPTSTRPMEPLEVPLVEAREVEKIKALAGHRARVRGRVFRVGHSAKSNTYFLSFGPSRGAFTGVIFASSLESFEKKKLHPRNYEGREVELAGEIKDHPKYGLEMILEEPAQVRILN